MKRSAAFATGAAVVTLGVAVGLAGWLAISTRGYPLDDAWIHLNYARSLLSEGTFGYVAGSWENGSTAPLWSLALALPLAATDDPFTASKLLGLLALTAHVFWLGRWVTRLSNPWIGATASLLATLDPWTIVLAGTGMEPVAAMACASWALDAALRRRPLEAGLASGCALLLRPEMGLVGLALAAVVGPRDAGSEGRAPTRIPPLVGLWLPPLALGGAWLLYGWAVTGHPLPNTFRVKTGAEIELVEQARALRALFLSEDAFPNLVAGLLIVLGSWQVARVRARALIPTLLAPLGLLLFLFFQLPLGYDGGTAAPGSIENVYFARYPLLVSGFAIGLIALGLAPIASGLARLSLPSVRTSASLGALVLVGYAALPWQRFRSELYATYRANCAEIEALPISMAYWIRDNLPPDAVLGVSDAGALCYFSERRTIDLIGLNTHELIAAEDPVLWLHEQGLSHLAVWPRWHGELHRDPRFQAEPTQVVRVEKRTIVPMNDLVLFEVQITP